MFKKFAITMTLITAFVVQFAAKNDADALPPTGDWAICVGMNWSEADCGYYELFESTGTSTGLAIGGPNEADGWWDCASVGRNGCRAVKIRGITPTYVIDTSTTTTVAGGSSTSSTTTVAGGSSTSSTTTVAGGSSTSSTTTIAAGSSTSSTTTIAPSLARCPTAVCGYAVVDDQNYVYGVIVCSDACTGTRMTQSYMGCPAGCRLILQSQQTSDGNVAGWHGQDVKYNEGSQTFSLPSGGTIKSGDKLEEAIFPTTTTTSTTALSSSLTIPTATVPANNSASVIEDIAAPSGVVYESAAKYVAAETETVMSTKSIEIKLPMIPVRELNYEVSFDPAGPTQKVVIETGKIVDNLVIKNESKKSFKKLSFFAVSAVEGSRISVDQKMFKNRNGLISVTLGSSVAVYAQVNIKVTSAKKYSSCKELIKDYPGGVVATAKWGDMKTSKQKVNYVAKPVNNVRVYNLNQNLDLDKDKIVCETNN
jgi:hypothetical protein